MALSSHYHFGEYYLVRSLTTTSIIALILMSVYQLNVTLELLKKLIDHIEDADAALERHSAKNSTLGKIMFEPLQQNAHQTYYKHESAIIMNIVIFTTLIALSMAGLVVAIRKHALMLTVYAISLDVIYLASFLYSARVPSLHCAFIVFVSILTFMRAHHLWLKESEAKIHLIQAQSTATTNSNSSCSDDILKNVV